MKVLIAIVRETFLRLRRDKIFSPAIIVGLSLLGLSGLASYWGIEEFFKILYDLGTAAFQLTGSTVAIFWGTKLISDSRQEGSLEVQLASPVSRSVWIVGKFLGLSSALIVLALIFLLGWQGIFWSYGIGWLSSKDFLIFAFLTLSWIVIGGFSILFASFTSPGIALFCSGWSFLTGLISAPIAQALAPDTPLYTRRIVETLASFWNLHLFNLSSMYSRTEALSELYLLSRFSYGLLLIALSLSLACLIFQNRDLIAS